MKPCLREEDSKTGPGPIETKDAQGIEAGLEGSRYPDTFDWSIYDQIEGKYGEKPRGGVVFNTTFKLVNHHASCSKCHHSFEIDAYGRGCFHNCIYCYAKDQLETPRLLEQAATLSCQSCGSPQGFLHGIRND